MFVFQHSLVHCSLIRLLLLFVCLFIYQLLLLCCLYFMLVVRIIFSWRFFFFFFWNFIFVFYSINSIFVYVFVFSIHRLWGRLFLIRTFYGDSLNSQSVGENELCERVRERQSMESLIVVYIEYMNDRNVLCRKLMLFGLIKHNTTTL